MNWDKVKSEVVAIVPIVVAWANKKWSLGLDSQAILGIFGLAAMIIGKHWHLDVKGAASPSPLPKAAALIAVALALGTMVGCASLKEMPDADLANFVQAQAQGDVQLGLSVAAGLDPNAAAAIKADALVVSKVINGAVLPLFTGSAADLPASILNTATTLLTKQIAGIRNGPMIVGYVRQALSAVQPMLGLPSSPAVTLPPRTRGALIGFFTGASAGIAAVAGGGP